MNTTDRRRPPRGGARIADRPACALCGHEHPSDHHERDAGDLTPEPAVELGYCPELAALRTGADR